jgi:aryl-alcohol dehydrogenase-like predicted oxidoreductase
LGTKLYEPMGDGPNDRGLSAFHIRRACEDSLRRLQTDHIDLYQMHHVDRSTTWDEIWQAMDTLVAQGKVIYVGSSNFAGWHIASAVETARRRYSFGLVSEQSLYNLTNRVVELEVLPACQEYGVGFMPWSPLAGGLLGGAVAGAAEGRRAGAEVQLRLMKDAPATALFSPTRPVRQEVEAYEAYCAEREEAPGIVALAWLLHQPGVTAPVIGPRTIQQLRDAERSLEVELDDAALARLDEIWPGPGGTAPEAYAW